MDETMAQHAFSPSLFTDEELSAMEKFLKNACDNQKGIDSSDMTLLKCSKQKSKMYFDNCK